MRDPKLNTKLETDQGRHQEGSSALHTLCTYMHRYWQAQVHLCKCTHIQTALHRVGEREKGQIDRERQ